MGRARSLFALIPLLGATAAPSATSGSPPISACAEAKIWAAANVATLPHDLEGLAALPLRHRFATLATMPSSEVRALWKQHLGAFVADPANASAHQLRLQATLPDGVTDEVRSVVASLIKHDADWLLEDGLSEGSRRARVLVFRRKLALTLDAGTQLALLSPFGINDVGNVAPGGVASHISVSESTTELCNCTTYGQYCNGGWGICVEVEPTCVPWQLPFSGLWVNGMCWLDQ